AELLSSRPSGGPPRGACAEQAAAATPRLAPETASVGSAGARHAAIAAQPGAEQLTELNTGIITCSEECVAADSEGDQAWHVLFRPGGEEDLQTLRDVFQACDANSDGSINLRELIKACRQRPEVATFFGLPSEIHQEGPSRPAVMEFFQGADADNDREITWEELCRFWRERRPATSSASPAPLSPPPQEAAEAARFGERASDEPAWGGGVGDGAVLTVAPTPRTEIAGLRQQLAAARASEQRLLQAAEQSEELQRAQAQLQVMDLIRAAMYSMAKPQRANHPRGIIGRLYSLCGPSPLMQRAADQLGGLAPAELGAAIGRLASSGSNSCACHFDSSPLDEGLLAILRVQLDRCGPDHLHCPRAPQCGPSACGLLVAAGLGLLLGAACTLGLQAALAGRARTPVAAPAAEQPVVLVDYPEDPNPTWHRRLLLHELGPGRWVCATPGFSVQVLDLTGHRVLPLARSAPWPAQVRGDVCCFDPLTLDRRDDLFLRDGQLARVIADGSMIGDRAVVRGEIGLYHIDEAAGEWVPTTNLATDPKFADWPFEGPSAARELITDVAAAGLELHLYPTWWESRGGVKSQGSVAREVRLGFDYLRIMQSYDQLNLQALASAELRCRRVIVRQRAARRNPKAPDFTGLEKVAQSNFDESGGLRVTEFDKYMAEQQKTSGTVLKSPRQDLEEQGNEKKRKAGRILGSGKPSASLNREVLTSHCDSFPLPLRAFDGVGGGGDRAVSFRLPTRAGDLPSAAALAADAATALNSMSASRVGRPLQLRRPRPTKQVVASAQQSILDRVAGRVDDQRPPPPEEDLSNALPEPLKCTDMRPTSDATSRVPIQLERLKILKNDTAPKEVLGVAGADAHRLRADPWRRIERRPERAGAGGPPPRPCADPRLRQSRRLLKELVTTLYRGNLAVFRLIVDARVPNHWHRRPPHSYLATPGAASALHLGDEPWNQELLLLELRGAAVDLQAGISEVFDVVDGKGIWAPVAAEDAGIFYEPMVNVLSGRGYTLWDNVEGDPNLDMVGFELQGAKFSWRQRRCRFWRLWHALWQLELLPGCAGEVTRIVLGHLVNFFTQARPPLSGHAIHAGVFGKHELHDVCQRRERWRFADAREEEGPGLAGAQSGLAADFRELGADPEVEDSGWLGANAGDRPARRAARASNLVPVEAMKAVEAGPPRPRVTGIAPALPDSMAAPGRWQGPLVGARQRREAIHVEEARIALTGLYHAARDSASHGGVVLSLGDNLSGVLATERGRAHGPALSVICRRAAAVEPGAEVKWARRYVETARNPTDSDSRLAERGLLAPGEALRGGRLAARLGRLRGAAGEAAAGADSAAACPAPRPPGAGGGLGRGGVLEIFSGCSRLSGARRAAGLRILRRVGSSAGLQFNVLDVGAQQRIIQWVVWGHVGHAHLAPPCARWSVANDAGSKDSEGSRAGLGCVDFTVKVLKARHKSGAFVSLENLASSRLLKYPPFASMFNKMRCESIEYHCCRYEAPYKKPTAFVPNLPGLKRALGRSALRRDGEPLLDPRWERELAAAARVAQPEPLADPSCPRRFAIGWGRAAGHRLCGDSAERRRFALRSLGWAAGEPGELLGKIVVAPGQESYLKQRSVGPATLRVYQRECDDLTARWKAQHLAVETPEARDKALEGYLDKLCFDGEPSSRASNAIHALMFHIDEVRA
ncbi:unnamed protein product, partial [Prorocentrum cordatum]